MAGQAVETLLNKELGRRDFLSLLGTGLSLLLIVEAAEAIEEYLQPQNNAFRQLKKKIREEEAMPKAVFDYYSKTPFGPMVNVNFPDGKIRCYYLTSSDNNYQFKEVVLKDKQEMFWTCAYNPKKQQINLFDGFNPDQNQVVDSIKTLKDMKQALNPQVQSAVQK